MIRLRPATLRIAAALLLPAVAGAALSEEERRDILAHSRGGKSAPREWTPPPPAEPRPDFRPKNHPPPSRRNDSVREIRTSEAAAPGPATPPPNSGFAFLDAGVLIPRHTLSAGGARADLGDAFDRPMGGLSLTLGGSFILNKTDRIRLGAEAGYYADHVPWGVAAVGQAALVTGSVLSGNGNALNNLESPYYRMRTEASAWPVSVFCDYMVCSRDESVSVYAGPLAGVTTYWYSATFSGKTHDSGGTSPHAGLHAGLQLRLDKHTFLHFGYEYRRVASADYTPGFDLRVSDRNEHTLRLGIGGRF